MSQKTRSTKKRKKTTNNIKSAGRISADLKKQLKQNQRLMKMEEAQQKVNSAKIEEAQVLANLMFSVNAIAKVLTEKKIKVISAEVDETGHAVTDADGRIKTREVEVPIISIQELNIARMQVVNDYHKERAAQLEQEKRESQTYEYNGETYTAKEWSEVLGCTLVEFNEFVDMGCGIEDIVQTLSDKEFTDDEKELIDQKVQQAVSNARTVDTGNGESDSDEEDEPIEIDLEQLSESELELYLSDGTVPERLHV